MSVNELLLKDLGEFLIELGSPIECLKEQHIDVVKIFSELQESGKIDKGTYNNFISIPKAKKPTLNE